MPDFNIADTADYFHTLFSSTDDPWGFRTRWYEARKRTLTLASLPAQRYASAYEPGCANGELSAALAARCDALLVSDGASRAVTTAERRLAHLPHVRVTQAWVPQEWPEEQFDLIVISELAYYLDLGGLQALAQRILASLQPHGTVLACHWRRPIVGCMFDGDEVHYRLTRLLDLPLLNHTCERDFRLDVWSRDEQSVAEREGLVPSSDMDNASGSLLQPLRHLPSEGQSPQR